MLKKIAGLGLALGLTFTGAAASPVKAFEEVRAERTSTVLTENAASADAGKKENKEVAPVAPLEGAFSFVPLSGSAEAASADASEKEEVVAQATPQALGGESEAAAPAAANNIVPFKRVRRHSQAPPGALVVAGRPAMKEVAHDPRSERLKNSHVDISVHDEFWERLRQQRVAEQEKGAQQQEEPAPLSHLFGGDACAAG